MISRRSRQLLTAERKWGVSSLMPPKSDVGRLALQDVCAGIEPHSEHSTQFAAYVDVREKRKRLHSLLTLLYRRAARHDDAAASIQKFLASPDPKDLGAIRLLEELLAALKNGVDREGYAARLRHIRARVDELNAAMLALALDTSKCRCSLDAAES